MVVYLHVIDRKSREFNPMIYGLKIHVEETLFLAAAGTISSLFQMATARLTDETTRLKRGFWEIKLK